MDVKIDSEAMQSVVTKALMESISQEQRDLVIEQAVKALITPPRNSYGAAQPTPLQQAFDIAVQQACHAAARQALADSPEFQARLSGLFSETVKTAMESADYDLRAKVHEAVVLAVLSDR